MEKVYLILTRHIVNETKKSTVWSEWYILSCDDCFKTYDDALARLIDLRLIAESKRYYSVDYRVQTLFLH